MNMVVECVSLIFCNWSCTLKFWKMFPKDSHSMYHCNRSLQHPNVCVLLPARIIKVCVFPGPTTATATSNIWVFFLVACTHYKRLCLSRSNHCNKNPHHPSVFFLLPAHIINVGVSPGPTTATGTPNITSCDFETTDICGFTQVTSVDQFDWTRHSGKTSSAMTGPTNDHTYGTSAGG